MPADAPDISAIIVVRDRADMIAETVRSLRRQVLRPREILVIDDGSTDDSAGVAEAAGGDLVRVVRQSPAGIAAARNRGVAEARGGLLTFVDSDDLAPPRRMDALASALAAEPGAMIAAGAWRNFWDASVAAEEVAAPHLRGTKHAVMLTSCLIRSAAFRTVGPFSEGEDATCEPRWLMAVRGAGLGIARTVDIVTLRRIHRGNFSRRKSLDDLFEMLRSSPKGNRRSSRSG